jgi:hypothetical protein
VPKPAPAEQVNLAAGTHEANQEMAAAEVSEPQLAQSNEPEFQQALADKQAAATHADTAPAEFRKQEQQVIEQGLDLGLLVHRQHDRVLGWIQIQAHRVADFGLQLRVGGELKRLTPPRLDPESAPQPADRVMRHPNTPPA